MTNEEMMEELANIRMYINRILSILNKYDEKLVKDRMSELGYNDEFVSHQKEVKDFIQNREVLPADKTRII